jgi:transposase
MMSFCVCRLGADMEDSCHGKQIVAGRIMERDRAVVSQVPTVARRRLSAQGHPPGADGNSVRPEDGHRLERLANRSLRLFVQDVLAADPTVVAFGALATDARTAAGEIARRRSIGLVESARRLQFGEGSAGRAKTGPNPTDRGRSGSKHCLLTDAEGVPLVVHTTAANEHDSTTLLPLVVDLPAVAGKPGHPKRKPAGLVADKAFDSDALRSLLRWLGIVPLIPRRGDEQVGLGKVRWFIERTISWFHQFRRLRIRWERHPQMHQMFLSLAATIICYRIWIHTI